MGAPQATTASEYVLTSSGLPSRQFIQVITMLLQHDVGERPSASDLSQSPLLPPRIEDESLRAALNVMGTLFSTRICNLNQRARQLRAVLHIMMLYWPPSSRKR